MRYSADQALALQQHRDLLSLQQLQLNDIAQEVGKGNSLLTSRLTDVSPIIGDARRTQTSKKYRAGQRIMRLRLPQFLRDRTWTLAAYHSQGSWTVEIHPEFLRSFDTPALDYIRTGDLANVKEALHTGRLSLWDSTFHPWRQDFSLTLLGVSTSSGQLIHRAGAVLISS